MSTSTDHVDVVLLTRRAATVGWGVKQRYCAGMSRSLTLVLGTALVLMGLLWTGQGLGWIGGSPMTGVTLWAVVGPLAALLGVVLIVQGARHSDGHER